MSSNLNDKYGVTEVFIKHRYFMDLRIKLVLKEGNKLYLCSYQGDGFTKIQEIVTDKKLYSVKSGMLLFEAPENLFYIYEDGDYSFPRYKYIKHVGSSRSSKSWSIEEDLIRRCEETENLRCTVWRDTQTSLGETIWKDFRKVFPLSGRKYDFPQQTKAIYFKNTNSTIEPHGDDTTNAHGLTQDIAWLNEPYRMSKDTFDQIDQRSNQIIIDINPTGFHWSDALETNPRCIVIHSTFKQNPFCPIDQRLKILSYDPTNEINVKNGTADDYKWSVYGLGVKAEKPNKILDASPVTLEQFNNVQARTFIGIDWGKVDNFGIVAVKYHDGRLFVDELNYDSENEIIKKVSDKDRHLIMTSPDGDNGVVSYLFNKLNISKDLVLICDTNRPTKGALLRQKGYTVIPAPIKDIIEGISLLQSLEIYYTERSVNFKMEIDNYEWDSDRAGVLEKPIDAFNHCFVGDTLINTINGLKKIKDINTNDYVLTSNGFKQVLHKFNNGNKKVNKYLLQFDTFSICISSTPEHKIYTENGWKQISQLQSGMTLTVNNNLNLSSINIQEHKLVDVKIIDSWTENVYDIMVNETHEYFANGVLVHNCIDPLRYVAMYLRMNGIIRSL